MMKYDDELIDSYNFLLYYEVFTFHPPTLILAYRSCIHCPKHIIIFLCLVLLSWKMPLISSSSRLLLLFCIFFILNGQFTVNVNGDRNYIRKLKRNENQDSLTRKIYSPNKKSSDLVAFWYHLLYCFTKRRSQIIQVFTSEASDTAFLRAAKNKAMKKIF